MVRIQDDNSHDKAGDLFLCNNYRHLLMSLATIAQTGHAATVIYLEDILPVPAAMRMRLARACPKAIFIYTRDADQMAAFAHLPRVVPAIVRRNLTFGGRWGVMRPAGWESALLKDRRFATGYVYHAGFFMAKVVAGRCDRVVLREDGLNNYARLNVPPLKAVLRGLSGLTPRHQVWGEERWIDRVEVSHPDDLPAAVRAKAVRLTFRDVMDVLPPATARTIAAAFLQGVPVIARDTPTAVLLTQPIDAIGICSAAQKHQIYAQIVTDLTAAGYQVYVKPHPTESATDLPGIVALPPAFPVEAWPYITDQKFSRAVALCSAALVSGARTFSQQTTQLLPPHMFNASRFADWPPLLAKAMQAMLHAQRPAP